MPKPLVLDDGQVAELPDDQNLDASNIQLRGEALGYVITRDPAGTATAGLERYRTYSDGTIDAVRRNAEGLVSYRFRGCDIYLVARDAEGLETSESNVNAGSLNTQFYSNDGARVVPPIADDNEAVYPIGEYIIFCLQAGFTEHPQSDSTHAFSFSILNDTYLCVVINTVTRLTPLN